MSDSKYLPHRYSNRGLEDFADACLKHDIVANTDLCMFYRYLVQQQVRQLPAPPLYTLCENIYQFRVPTVGLFDFNVLLDLYCQQPNFRRKVNRCLGHIKGLVQRQAVDRWQDYLQAEVISFDHATVINYLHTCLSTHRAAFSPDAIIRVEYAKSEITISSPQDPRPHLLATFGEVQNCPKYYPQAYHSSGITAEMKSRSVNTNFLMYSELGVVAMRQHLLSDMDAYERRRKLNLLIAD